MTRIVPFWAILLLVVFAAGCATAPSTNTTSLNLRHHQLNIPTDSLAGLALMEESLHVKYENGEVLSVMVQNFSAMSLPEGMTGPEFMTRVYGASEPEVQALAAIREAVFSDVKTHSVDTLAEGLTAYRLGYPERVTVYVVDEEVEGSFLLVEGSDGRIDNVTKTITRR